MRLGRFHLYADRGAYGFGFARTTIFAGTATITNLYVGFGRLCVIQFRR